MVSHDFDFFKEINKMDVRAVDIVYIDFSKAFDKGFQVGIFLHFEDV